MRILMFFLLLPTWAAAQPAMVDPAQVVGLARGDINQNGLEERFLLLLDSEGGVDLMIFEERALLVYVDNFTETTRYAPEISALGSDGVEIDLHSTDGLGSHDWSWVIEWDSDRRVYAVSEMSLHTTPRMAGEAESYCRIELWSSTVHITKGDTPERVVAIDASPWPLLSPAPRPSFAPCEG